MHWVVLMFAAFMLIAITAVRVQICDTNPIPGLLSEHLLLHDFEDLTLTWMAVVHVVCTIPGETVVR